MCRISKIITFLESLRQAGWFDLFESDIQALLIFDPLITLWGNFDAPYLKLLNDASVASSCFYVRTCRRVRNSKKIATIRDFHLPVSFLCLSTRLTRRARAIFNRNPARYYSIIFRAPVHWIKSMVWHDNRMLLFYIRRRSDYIIGFIALAIGPNKSKKLTRLIAPVHNISGKVWMKNNIHGFSDRELDRLCSHVTLFFIQTLPRILCVGAINRVSFFDLFGPIAGAINPIM